MSGIFDTIEILDFGFPDVLPVSARLKKLFSLMKSYYEDPVDSNRNAYVIAEENSYPMLATDEQIKYAMLKRKFYIDAGIQDFTGSSKSEQIIWKKPVEIEQDPIDARVLALIEKLKTLALTPNDKEKIMQYNREEKLVLAMVSERDRKYYYLRKLDYRLDVGIDFNVPDDRSDLTTLLIIGGAALIALFMLKK